MERACAKSVSYTHLDVYKRQVYMDGEGHEFKRFDIQDGMGIVMLRRNGIEVAIISGRFSASTDQRARDLGLSFVFNGVKDKLATLMSLSEKLSLKADDCLLYTSRCV